MERYSRIVLPGWAHYVNQHGVRRQNFFCSAQDRLVYLMLLAKYFPLYEMALIGYSLTDTRVELVLIPEKEQLFKDGIGRLEEDFTRWRNPRGGRGGGPRQGCILSCPVEEDRVWAVVRCIEWSPVREGLVENAWDWGWSSARAHVTGIDSGGYLEMSGWRRAFNGESWKQYLEMTPVETPLYAEIRRNSITGRLLGSPATAMHFERELGRPLI